MKPVVVDASVGVKWFLREVHDTAALRWLYGEYALHVPDLFFPEIGSALAKRVRRGEMTEAQAKATLDAYVELPLQIHPSQPLTPVALEIACRTGQTVYDSLYVVLAADRNCGLVTADRKFYEAIKRSPMAAYVCWVEDLP